MATMLNIQMTDTHIIYREYVLAFTTFAKIRQQTGVIIHPSRSDDTVLGVGANFSSITQGCIKLDQIEISMNYLKSSTSLIRLLQCHVKTEDFP